MNRNKNLSHNNKRKGTSRKVKNMYSRNRQITCRPCKEENNWEIETPEGNVLDRHYHSRQECLEAGLRYAEEYGCDLHVCGCSCHKERRMY